MLRSHPEARLRQIKDDLAEWHANIRVPEDDEHPLAGIILHLIIRFPATYPSTPPAVELCTNVPHANVFPKTRMVHEQQAHRMQNFFELCIDMLGNCSALWQASMRPCGPSQRGVPGCFVIVLTPMRAAA